MKKAGFKFHLLLVVVFGFVTIITGQETTDDNSKDWISLFNGINLDGWQVEENAATFSVEDGAIKVAGKRAHIYYVGDVQKHEFTDFEFKARVMTKPNSNSGIYFHTIYQPTGWPEYGYEVQVNNTQGDWRRTGSLYDIVDIREKYVGDNEWYTEYIKVVGNRVIIKVNDIVVVDYTEPENPIREKHANRLIGKGTFAFQGHDPGSVVFYKDVMVRPLP